MLIISVKWLLIMEMIDALQPMLNIKASSKIYQMLKSHQNNNQEAPANNSCNVAITKIIKEALSSNVCDNATQNQ